MLVACVLVLVDVTGLWLILVACRLVLADVGGLPVFQCWLMLGWSILVQAEFCGLYPSAGYVGGLCSSAE
jgi:hypothetical protein